MKYWAQLTCENILDREKKSQENKKTRIKKWRFRCQELQ